MKIAPRGHSRQDDEDRVGHCLRSPAIGHLPDPAQAPRQTSAMRRSERKKASCLLGVKAARGTTV